MKMKCCYKTLHGCDFNADKKVNTQDASSAPPKLQTSNELYYTALSVRYQLVHLSLSLDRDCSKP